MLPGRWQPVREFFDLVMAPLIEAGNAGYFAIERNGPDGKKWIVLRPESVELQAEDPALEATRLVRGPVDAPVTSAVPPAVTTVTVRQPRRRLRRALPVSGSARMRPWPSTPPPSRSPVAAVS